MDLDILSFRRLLSKPKLLGRESKATDKHLLHNTRSNVDLAILSFRRLLSKPKLLGRESKYFHVSLRINLVKNKQINQTEV